MRLDLRAAAIAPVKSGDIAIVPGKPEESELIKRIFSHEPDDIMPPPSAKQEITAEQKDTLRRWIAGGAPYSEHWSFIAPVRPPVPEIAQPGGPPAHPIDAFVGATLQKSGLSPAPPADPATLIRRLSLDMTGLPPDEARVPSLIQDLSQFPPGSPEHEKRYAAYVDELLASPAYGERWARKWLDLARYADTNGYEKDRTRQIWPWRDWVVKALNDDMPFDEFTVEQLAGDMLPGATASQLIATGFHRNSMLNEEGGIDPLEFRFHAMADRMGVTGATWLGLTLHCAQCHTHKFDPIPHKEYFSTMAFLNNADEPDFSIPPPDAEQQERRRAEKLSSLIAALPDKWPSGPVDWKAPRPLAFTSAQNESAATQEDGSILLPPQGPDRARYTVEIDAGDAPVTHLKLEALTDPSLPSTGPGRTPHGNFVLTEIAVTTASGEKVTIASGSAAGAQPGFPVDRAFDGNPSTGWAVDAPGENLHETKSAVFVFAKPVKGSLTVVLDQQFGGGHTIGRVRLSTGVQQAPAVPAEAAEDAFTTWLAAQRTRATQWTPLKPQRAVSNLPLLTVLPDDSVLASGDITKADTYDLDFAVAPGTAITAVKLEALPHDSLPAHGPGMAYYEGPKGDFFLGEFQLSADGQPVKLASATDSYTSNGFGSHAGSLKAIDGDPQTGWSTSGGEGRAHEAVFVPAKPVTAHDGRLSLKMLFGRHYACSLGRFRISFATAPAAMASPLSAGEQTLLLKEDGALTSAERDTLRTAFLLNAPELAAARKEIEALRRPAPWQTTLVMRERPAENPRPTYIHHRGEFTQPGEKVSPGVLSVLPPLPKDAPPNRLSFARWLVSRENPLTARVVVNRSWAAFFGRGIVKTVDDFGYQGDLPTHPELLDWLAIEFMDRGWSVKKLHRLIVTSRTYRQSSRIAGAGAEKDGENTLLWRGPRHRLEAEQIRDSALAVCGMLSQKMGGPGVFPPQPPGVTTEGTYGAMEWKTETGEDRYRRSLYTFTKRTAPFAMSNTFDAPTGEACVARRDVSNTPLQSLTLLNDVTFMEASRSLAGSIAAQSGDTAAKMRTLVTHVFSRPAEDGEVVTLTAFFTAQEQRFASGELDTARTAGAGASPAAAAWTLTVRALLNTDEFVTRQ